MVTPTLRSLTGATITMADWEATATVVAAMAEVVAVVEQVVTAVDIVALEVEVGIM